MKVFNYPINFAKTQSVKGFWQNSQNQNFNKNLNPKTPDFSSLQSYPLNYYSDNLAFMARVDKGLGRFYDVNKDIMPKTVKNYIENIPAGDRKNITPIMAQYNAFEELILAENTDEVRVLYPDEPLFENLKSIDESRATQGLLYEIRMMKDDLENEGSSVLSTGEDFTLYLLKKVFLENKSLNQINEDLDCDLNPVFKKENKEYIHYSSFSALGIKLPKQEYLTSLRYTKEGYSDIMGGKISEAQSAFWESLSIQERQERRKASLNKLENWWHGLSNEDKIALLEKQDSEIKLLNEYKKAQKSAPKPQNTKNDPKTQTTEGKAGKDDFKNGAETRPKIKEEKLETSLSKDEIFLEWARKNLEIFELSLNDEQRAELNQKRAEAQLSRWQNLTPEEKTALIEKMQSGRMNQKMAMIDAWNNCPEIREHLSDFMKENNLHGAFGIIYRDGGFSEAQSRIMTAFWEKYPDDAVKLGDEIRNSFTKIKESINNDTFDDLKIAILDKQAEIKKARKQKKKNGANNLSKANSAPQISLKEAQERFIEYYHSMYYFMPKEFLDSYCDFALDKLKDARALDIWTRTNIDKVEADEMKYLSDKIEPIQDSPEMFKKKRAIEQAMAEILYEASNKDEAAASLFGVKFKDLQLMLLMAEPRIIFPVKFNYGANSNIELNKRPDYSKLEGLYEKYKRPVTVGSQEYFERFFVRRLIETGQVKVGDFKTLHKSTLELKSFLDKYGASAECVFANGKCPGNAYAAKKMSDFFDKEWLSKS